MDTRLCFGESCDEWEVRPGVACKLCAANPLTNPVVTTCGHAFCWPCMYRFLQGQAKPCPVCTTILSSDINVVPHFYNNGVFMLYLPTTKELEKELREQNDDMEHDGIRVDTILVVARALGFYWVRVE